MLAFYTVSDLKLECKIEISSKNGNLYFCSRFSVLGCHYSSARHKAKRAASSKWHVKMNVDGEPRDSNTEGHLSP